MRVCRRAFRIGLFACALFSACADEPQAPPAPGSDSPGRVITGAGTSVAGSGSSTSDGFDAGAPPDTFADAAIDVGASRDPRGSVRWTDPAGDTTLSTDGLRRYLLDVREVQGDVQGGELIFRVRIDRTLASHFAFPGIDGERTGGVPIEILLDTDDDASTGGSPFWAEDADRPLVGYEYELTVLLGFTMICGDAGGEGHAAGDAIVDSDECEITGNMGTYFLWPVRSERDGGFVSPVPIEAEESDYVSFEGSEIVVRVPLTWLELEAGDVVRLCYQEQDEGPASGLGYSEDQWLRL